MAAWWNTDWKKRKKIIIRPHQGMAAISNLPIRVHLINKGYELSKSGARFGIGSSNNNMMEQHWWRFENTAVDDGYNDDDFTLGGSASYSGTSKVGSYSLALNGSTDYAYFAGATAKADTRGGLSVWVRLSSIAADQTVFSLGDTDADTVARLYFDSSEGEFTWEVRSTGTAKTLSTSGASISTGVWYHIALFVDNDDVGKIFIDKEYLGSSSDCKWFNYAGSALDNTRIGCDIFNGTGNANFLNGYIDDLRIYDYPTSYVDIEWLNNSDSGQTITIPRIDFDDFKASGADIRFTDSSGNLLKHEIEIWGAPNPSTTTGTCTASTGINDIYDTGANFTTAGVIKGMIVHNSTRDCISIVVDVTSSTRLQISHPTGTTAGSEDWQSGDDYEIVPQAVIWFKAALFGASVAQNEFYMYYDNSAASDGQDVLNVWTNFEYVLHGKPDLVSNNTGGLFVDSTGIGYYASAHGDVQPGTFTNGSCGWYLPGGDDYIQVPDTVDNFMDDSSTQYWSVITLINIPDVTTYHNVWALKNTTHQKLEITTASRINYENGQTTEGVTYTGYTVPVDVEVFTNAKWQLISAEQKVYVGDAGGDGAYGSMSINPSEWSAPSGDNYIGNDPDNATYDGKGHYSDFMVATSALPTAYLQQMNDMMRGDDQEHTVVVCGEEPTLYLTSISDNGPKYAGQDITFTLNYEYPLPLDMRVCKTASCPAGTCTSGWASSDSDAATPATAVYTTVSDDHGTNNYYVYGFDADDSAIVGVNNPLSSSFTITAPAIDSISSDTPKYAGQDITFTVNWTWAQGNVDIRVCKTDSLTAGVCDGGEWGSDLDTGSTGSITYTSLAGDVGTNNYYVYVMDHTDSSLVAHNAPQSDSFVINGPIISSVTDSPDPSLVGDQVTFSVDWLWPIGNVDVFICKVDNCTSAGCVGGANQTWASVSDTAQDPAKLKYSTTSPSTKDYYVFIYDHSDSSLFSSSTHGTFDVNISGIYLHFEPFRRRKGPNDYVSRWDFDEATGSIVYDRNSSTSNDLTISGASWSESGRFYYCLDFDGTDDYVYSTSISDYSNDLGAISIRFNTDTLTVDRTIFSICDWSTTDQTYIKVTHLTSGELQVKMVVDGVTYVDLTTTSTFAIETWYDLIIYQDGTGIKLYVENEEQAVTETTNRYKYVWLKTLITDATNKADRVIIGGYGAGSALTEPFDGKIDDLKIYNTSLSTIDLEDIYGISSFVTGTNCSITERSKDENQIYNSVQVLGNNAISSDTVEDADSQQTYGIRELTYTDRSIEDTSDANEVANRILDRYKDPIERITLAVQTRYMREVVGDVVELTDTNTGLSTSEYRIVDIERKYGKNGDVVIYNIESK